MNNILSLTWYVESPIDFEYKQYILFDYLQKVDHNFHEKVLSPYLLHMEKLVDELQSFNASFNMLKSQFDKNRYIYFENTKLEGEDDSIILEIKDLVEFAIPQIEPRIKTGYYILKRNKQILF